jgi:hypothetical protein
MAEDQSSMPTSIGSVSQSEVQLAFSGPALVCDRFVITSHSGGMRIAFLERDPSGAPPQFRAAVMLSYSDALELRKLLETMLKPIEAQIVEAVGKTSGSGR